MGSLTPRRLHPREITRYSLNKRLGGLPEPVLAFRRREKSLAPGRIRSPDRYHVWSENPGYQIGLFLSSESFEVGYDACNELSVDENNNRALCDGRGVYDR